MTTNSNNIKRRRFLKNIFSGIGILALAETTYLIFNYLKPGSSKEKEETIYFEAGEINSFKINSITSFKNRGFFLARLKDGNFIALSAQCTHLGCILDFDAKANQLICPCHSSIFNIEGRVLQSPATKNLNRLEVKIDKQKVLVNINSIRS